MPTADNERTNAVQQWLHKAHEDLCAARLLSAGETIVHSPAVFHCQQAAEKYLKAYLTWKQREFPKTHDLVQLLDLVSACDQKLAERLDDVAELTPYGVQLRYPGEFPLPTKHEVAAALAIALQTQKTIELVIGTLPM